MTFRTPPTEPGTPATQTQPPEPSNSITQLFQAAVERAFSWIRSPFGWGEMPSAQEGGPDEEADAQVTSVGQSALGTSQPAGKTLSTEERQEKFAALQQRLAEMQADVGELQEATPQEQSTPHCFDSVDRENGGEPVGALQPKRLVFPTPDKATQDDSAD